MKKFCSRTLRQRDRPAAGPTPPIGRPVHAQATIAQATIAQASMLHCNMAPELRPVGHVGYAHRVACPLGVGHVGHAPACAVVGHVGYAHTSPDQSR